jgi:hypothetical protein
MLWAGRVVSALPVVMLLLSATMKFVKPPEVVKGFADLGWKEDLAIGLAIVEIVCTVIYVIPQTAVLGAVLLTAILVALLRRMCASAIHSLAPSSSACLSGEGFGCAISGCGPFCRFEADAVFAASHRFQSQQSATTIWKRCVPWPFSMSSLLWR